MTSIYFWASYKTVIVKEKTLGQCWGHCQCDFGDEVMMTIKSLVPPQEENFVTWLSTLLGKQVLIDKEFKIFISKLQQGKEPIIALDAKQPKNWIGVGRPLELDIKCTETGHCRRTFGIRHRMEFGMGPLEIGIMNYFR